VLVQAVLRVADSHVQQTQSAADKHLLRSSDGPRLHQNGSKDESTADTRCVDWRSVREIMMSQFLLSAAMLLYRADFAVTVSERYGTSNTTNGYISSLSSIIGTLTGFAMGHIADVYAGNTRRLFVHSAVLCSPCVCL